MVAVMTLTGRYRRARLLALYAQYHFTPAPGGTLPVYRGALRRRTGDVRGAIEDLQSALADKPSRLGARIELCLALREAGLRSDAEEHLGLITRDAAPLLVDAADLLAIDWQREPARLRSDDVLEEALRAMRGNRSSSTVTWFDRTGSMRLLHPTHALADAAQRALSQRRPAATGGGPPGPPAPPLRRTPG